MTIARTPQELEPRAYAANPIGVRFAVAAFVTTTGNVVLDTTSPVSDVRATLHSVVLGAGGTFALARRSATASVAIPYAWGTVTGKVAETASSIERSGLADARLRLAISLVGGQALPLAAFARRTPGTIVGISLTTAVPTGQYFPDKLINLGTNDYNMDNGCPAPNSARFAANQVVLVLFQMLVIQQQQIVFCCCRI